MLVTRSGERQETVLQQISIGGCFTGWEENIYAGDEFRLEIELPNKNRLPLRCKAVYRFEHTGVGARFLDITEFEQELISSIISHRLVLEGLPIEIDAFRQPAVFSAPVDTLPPASGERARRELLLEKLMANDDSV